MTIKEDVLYDLLFRSMERYVKLKLKMEEQEFDNRPIKRKKNNAEGIPLPKPGTEMNSEEDLLAYIHNSH
jgi:hypothetical protein